ncbi:MAG TPA: purine-nucleoside phosphorylase [Anaerolineaceae bacterium]|nr:purine-nucleoside phosphorylase [Anaerolineaceae bacterium]
METFVTVEQIDQAAEAVRTHISISPKTGMILGSGLGELAEMVEQASVIPVAEIPNWPVSTVLGHQGKLVVGQIERQSVLVLQGRVHFYEGYSMSQVTLPIRVMKRLGVENLIVTNAAGAINPAFKPGDVMLINDHINIIGMSGENPLRGPNLSEFGERFPDMSQAYDRQYMVLARRAAERSGVPLHEGIYACLAGPSFESPADLRFLRAAGADAVGMSTVPEVIVARHSGIRVLGLSGISNKANLDGSTITTHEEVLEAGKVIAPKLKSIILGVLGQL